MYDLFPAEDLDQIFADLRPPPIHDFDQPEGITIGQIKDWEKQFTAPGILQTNLVDPIKSAINYPFEKIAEYDKQSIPADWQGPGGSGGYASNWRHAANTALLKKKLSEKGFGDIGGGILSFGGGLLHELTADSPIWKDKAEMSDPFLLDAGQSLRLTPEFKSDILANLFGALKGETGISDTKMFENLLTEMSKDDAWSTAFENLIAEEQEEEAESPTHRFQMHRVPTRNRRPWEPTHKWIDPFANRILKKDAWIKRMQERKGVDEIPTLKSDTSFITRKPTTSPFLHTPIHGGVGESKGRDFQPQRPDKPGGFTDPGKGSYGPHKAKGGLAQFSRPGYFKGALADTKEGKAMSPGTRADYSPGQGHRENVGRPPGGGDPRMTYTAPPRKSTPERDVWNLKRWEPESGTWFGGPTQKYLRGADLNKWYALKRKEFYESLEDDEPETYSEFDIIPEDKYYELEIGRNYVPTGEDLLTIGPYEKHSGSALRSYPYESELAKGGLAKVLGV